MQTKTRSAVRAEFTSRGWSISAWAKQRGYSPQLVHSILHDNDKTPTRKCLRGESHNIAVELKLKDGEVSRLPAAPMALSHFAGA